MTLVNRASCVEHLRLVAITDNLRDGVSGLVSRAVAARRGGATMIQLRLPDDGARTLVDVARLLVSSADIPLVIHGRPDVAIASGAAGVHLGVHDLPVSDVRRIVGETLLIGRSAATPADLAQAGNADYITLGPLFAADARRPEPTIGVSSFERLVRDTTSPVVAIGGISVETARSAMRAGASGVAMISGIFGASDPERAARDVRAAIEK
jgi:thiamine-phosphate pyrophosphorylase